MIVSASGDAAVRGMRRGDLLVGVQHTPLPEGATLAHVQELMEELPRPLALNLYRPTPLELHKADFSAAATDATAAGHEALLKYDFSVFRDEARDFGGWQEDPIAPEAFLKGGTSKGTPNIDSKQRRQSSLSRYQSIIDSNLCDLSASVWNPPSKEEINKLRTARQQYETGNRNMTTEEESTRKPEVIEEILSSEDGSQMSEEDEEVIQSFLASVSRQRNYWINELHHEEDPETALFDAYEGITYF